MRTLRFRKFALLSALPALWLGVTQGLAADTNPSKGKEIRFNRDIRPLLSDNCFLCHGPDKNHRKAKLRLDVRDEAIANGAIVPGKPDESELIARIFTSDEDDIMPPRDTHKELKPADKELLKQWIAAGAPYEPHWAYIPPKRPEVPKVEKKDWIKSPVDSFILNELETRKIQPTKEADKRTLLRRLSLDLIGLPPTPEELAAFLADSDPKAYERQIDRLLASPHFGERMASPWLDTVRFADTVGYHGDQNQNIFPYRDYVIESFNKNKPFDQFTIEQIAGDLLPNPTVEQRIATGFNRLNMMTREGGAQPQEYIAKYQADRVRTVSTTWLGSTMACAECHDHKFDPFTTKDFYQLSAYFADIKQWGVYNDYTYTPNPDLKGWSNDHPFPPELEVDSPYLKRRLARVKQQIKEVQSASGTKLASDKQKEAAFQEWCKDTAAFLKQHPSGWVTPSAEVQMTAKNANNSPEGKAVVESDGTILFSGKPGDNIQVKVPLSTGRLSALRLELLPHESHNGSILRGDGNSTTINLAAQLVREGEKNQKLGFYYAEADHKEERYANGFAIIGIADAWRTSIKNRTAKQTGVWLLDKPLQAKEGDQLLVSLGASAVGSVRLSLSPIASDEPLKGIPAAELAKALESDPGKRTPSDSRLLFGSYLLSTAWDGEAFSKFKGLLAEARECRDGRAMTLVTEAAKPITTRVLPRGNWLDESGEVVQPLPPEFLFKGKPPEGKAYTRLDLANWLVSPENPLTARTFVNRLWKQYFGAGICNTVDDLGLQGDTPSHPELLDWLAVEFMESGWNVKHMVRLMVQSATYRQDSNLRPELKDIDPANRLLAFQNPRRLEAEFVRDNALAVAGLLNDEIGGPSAYPYQPAGYYVNLQFPDRDYYAHKDERQYRRGVYTHWQRTFLHPMMANFDAPSREECTANRTVSNTPQQALTLLNDPTFMEASKVFAQKIIKSGKSDEERLEALFQRALARPIKSNEKNSLTKFLAEQREHYRAKPEEAQKAIQVGLAKPPRDVEAAELAAWASVCRVVLNLHETITAY